MADILMMADFRIIPIRLVSILALFILLFKSADKHQACFEE